MSMIPHNGMGQQHAMQYFQGGGVYPGMGPCWPGAPAPWQNQMIMSSWQQQQQTANWPSMNPYPVPNMMFGGGITDGWRPGFRGGSSGGGGAKSDTVATGEAPVPDDDRLTLFPSRVVSGADQRTTLIVRNIPTKMTQEHFKTLVSDNFSGKIDFVYVPFDWKTGGALGYAFINMKHVTDVLPFYEAFHGFSLQQSNSKKVWRVAYARLQGKEELAAHFASRSPNKNIAPEFDITRGGGMESASGETQADGPATAEPRREESRRARRARVRADTKAQSREQQPVC